MAIKQAAHTYADHELEAAPFDDRGRVKPLVRINNMRQVQEGLFELSGVRQREIRWELIREGFEFEGDMPDQLIDELASVIFRHDMMKFLLDNMK
jgi:hypothetical protein